MRIEAERLGRSFEGRTALRELGFEIRPGERVALVGPNGSGKSTLNRILIGLLRYEGSLRLDGRDATRGRRDLAPLIAYVPQIAPRVAAPVGELVAALTRLREAPPERVGKVALRLGLDLTSLDRTPFHGLSGGTKQKLLVSLALASRARLLILDEPTASLDARSRERLFAILDELDPGVTVLLCSHRIEEVRHRVDRVLALEEGRLAYDGPVADFLAAPAPFAIELDGGCGRDA